MDIFAQRLTKLIEANKITQYKIAKDFKCSKSTVINWGDGANESKAT